MGIKGWQYFWKLTSLIEFITSSTFPELIMVPQLRNLERTTNTQLEVQANAFRQVGIHRVGLT
jgi:hypothetical protein